MLQPAFAPPNMGCFDSPLSGCAKHVEGGLREMWIFAFLTAGENHCGQRARQRRPSFKTLIDSDLKYYEMAQAVWRNQ
ncbi:hypothetical protein [Rhizobium sp. MHM7A]|uniref:hypothetical protein n=1 Tax=Rhizobium sp. MHM7A TaxID=2583233 RepID=UPI001106F3B6|nr:hypothetical protein [Rhizobium sp. MHM7A]TLX10328.1 hypothetical protein FFR93_23185 [Rhizobium sp. MHM7A]